MDVFGRQLYDHYRGLLPESFREVGERDDGNIQVYEHPKWYFTSFDEWEPHLRKAMERVRGRTLDIGCGAGRVALHLQQSGVSVVGIDHSPMAIRICRERGLKDARVFSISRVSANRLGIFDSIVMTGNNFGLLGNSNRARWLLRRFYRMTTDQGRIIAKTTDPYTTDDPIHLAYQERNRARGRMGGQ